MRSQLINNNHSNSSNRLSGEGSHSSAYGGGVRATGLGMSTGVSNVGSSSLLGTTATVVHDAHRPGAALVEQRLGIVKRNRGGTRGESPIPASQPPCEHYPAFDTTTAISQTSVDVIRLLAADVIDCLVFPDAHT